jgi:hypothetical protein
MMSARTGFRVAAFIFVLFAIGHTAGFLTFRPPTADAAAVWRSMSEVRFGGNGADARRFSYGGFYLGFGLIISALTLLQAYVSWVSGELAAKGMKEGRDLGIALVILQIIGAVLSFRYFSIVPALFSVALALLLSWSCVRVRVQST